MAGRRVQSFGWALQLVALGIVGSALVLGLSTGALRVEIALMFGGGTLFLVGRWLRERSGD